MNVFETCADVTHIWFYWIRVERAQQLLYTGVSS